MITVCTNGIEGYLCIRLQPLAAKDNGAVAGLAQQLRYESDWTHFPYVHAHEAHRSRNR